MKHNTPAQEVKSLGTLFFTFFKIGLFTFGGGYAMIALLEEEFIQRRKWLDKDEFLDMTAIAESTPGPVAINSATYLGYKLAKVPGAATATVAVCLPSFLIIYAISLFFEQFTQLTVIASAFKGIQVCVIYLIFSAGVRMLKALDKSPFATGVLAAVMLVMVGLSLAGVSVSSILRQVWLHGSSAAERKGSKMFLKLFLTFLEIGAVSFGGGYGMISLIREKVLLNGWLSEAEFLSFIAVSESTPGPLAVNMATFIGASQGGVPGALCATLGVVLPSFFIILLIAALIHDLLKYAGVEAFLSGVRPCVVALILSTALTMGLSTLLGISTAAETPSPAWRGIGILAILAGVRLIWQKARGKAPSPIGMILLSAVLGAVLYQ